MRTFDYVDRGVPVLLRMFNMRVRGYRAIGHARDGAPPGFAAPPDEPTIEWDEEAAKIVDVRPPDIVEEDDSSGIIAH